MNKKNFPFEFSTEASINLAGDSELLSALVAANFFAIFVGIESRDTDTLVLTRKKQNTRRSLQESIYKIYDAAFSYSPVSSSALTASRATLPKG